MQTQLEEGMIADGRVHENISGAAEGEIAFGQFAVRGTDPAKQFTAADGTSGDVVAGIAAYMTSGDIENLKYEDKDAMRVLRKGVIWAKLSENASESVVTGDEVAVFNDGYAIKKSEAEGISTGSGVAVLLENAEFASAGDPGDVVKVEINFPTATSESDLTA